jgi:hypothetical protein
MNAFEQHGIDHLSASSINNWINVPSLWLLEKGMGFKSGVGCAAYRGTAAEAGISAALFNHELPLADAVDVALPIYDRLSAFSTDPKRADERLAIPGMIVEGMTLRGHGVPLPPNGDQHRIEIRVEGLPVPIIGYLDWLYPNEIIDLKTTHRVPSAMADNHLRQASIYQAAHEDKDVRFFYASSKKSCIHTLTREDYELAMAQVEGAARRLARFLALSGDMAELAAIIPHNSDGFYFNAPATKAKAVEVYGY